MEWWSVFEVSSGNEQLCWIVICATITSRLWSQYLIVSPTSDASFAYKVHILLVTPQSNINTLWLFSKAYLSLLVRVRRGLRLWWCFVCYYCQWQLHSEERWCVASALHVSTDQRQGFSRVSSHWLINVNIFQLHAADISSQCSSEIFLTKQSFSH